jgi:hypothetical protein
LCEDKLLTNTQINLDKLYHEVQNTERFRFDQNTLPEIWVHLETQIRARADFPIFLPQAALTDDQIGWLNEVLFPQNFFAMRYSLLQGVGVNRKNRAN